MITIEINAAALPAGVKFRRQSINSNQEAGGRASLTFDLADTTATYRPAVGQAVELYENGGLEWAGVVDEPAEQKNPGGDEIFYNITAADNHALADRRTVAEAFTRQIAGNIVRWVIDNVLAVEGITAGTVEDGPQIGPVNSNHLYASQLMNEIADITGYKWRINADKTLDFLAPAEDVAAAIDSNSDIYDVRVWRDRTDYRNRQILKEITATTIEQNETPAPRPDGNTRTFTLRFAVAQKPRVFVDTGAGEAEVVSGDIGILGLDTGKKWYWSKGLNTLAQDEGETALNHTDTLRVRYRGQFKTTIILDNDAAITERQGVEGGSGIYELVENAGAIEGIEAGMEKAASLLRKHARIATKVSLASETINFRVGEIRPLTLAEHDVSGNYLVMSVNISDRGRADQKLLRQATLIDGEALGGWVRFFRTWLEKTSDTQIRADEVVRVLLRFVEELDDVTDILDLEDNAPPFRFNEPDDTNINWGRWQWFEYDYEVYFIMGAAFSVPVIRREP